MQCPKCARMAEGNFCQNCGYDLRQTIPPQNNTQYNPNFYSPSNPPNNYLPQQFPNQMPPNPNIPNYSPQNYQYGTPYPRNYAPQPTQPEWYLDGSIIGLLLALLGFYLIWDISLLLGIVLGLAAIILGVNSKKKNGRISTFTIIIASILFAIEILISANLYILSLIFS
jgi:hypothetical protein